MSKKKWNEEAAMNNNLSAETYENEDHEFAEELADGGERNQMAEKQAKAEKKRK
ncbi:hypothetical protein [Pontibacillus marinus]|uniref:Uncharacterized protein n=1 Tax=Pontibacillus marinus BH030004 = DSM 16465 TaxID=1385511 RepID=A0A0A5I3N8_9BACI|nr:hypothetical protein [Pontibacillus marinus]KGX90437.1 hypothetical protein N783_16800 [Pontibacillus marinus BH030004 = DSM 16465]